MGVAPFPLLSFEQVYAQREQVRASVVGRTMPPWGARSSCADYQADWSLSEGQIATVSQWVDEGALEGDPLPGAVPAEAPLVPACPGSISR